MTRLLDIHIAHVMALRGSEATQYKDMDWYDLMVMAERDFAALGVAKA